MELLKQQIEALIFCSEQSISLDEIAASLKLSFEWDLSDEEILSAIEEIKEKYSSDEFSFELMEISEGFQFLTKKQYYPAVSALIQHKSKRKLSVSQMETLAIIAYRQPVTKSEIEHIRGVSCDYAVQKLLEKELIEISGKSDGPGRPVLYSTSRSFMDYFGIRSVKDLPQLKDIHPVQNEIGVPSDLLAEEISATHVIHESESELTTESEVATSMEEMENNEEMTSEVSQDEIVTEEISSEENSEDNVHEIVSETGPMDEPASDDIPDRKTIFLENERTEIEQERLDEDKNSD